MKPPWDPGPYPENIFCVLKVAPLSLLNSYGGTPCVVSGINSTNPLVLSPHWVSVATAVPAMVSGGEMVMVFDSVVHPLASVIRNWKVVSEIMEPSFGILYTKEFPVILLLSEVYGAPLMLTS